MLDANKLVTQGDAKLLRDAGGDHAGEILVAPYALAPVHRHGYHDVEVSRVASRNHRLRKPVYQPIKHAQLPVELALPYHPAKHPGIRAKPNHLLEPAQRVRTEHAPFIAGGDVLSQRAPASWAPGLGDEFEQLPAAVYAHG